MDYTIVSFNIPMSVMQIFCLSTTFKPDDMFGFCIAYTSCGTKVVLPDLGFAINKAGAACLANNNQAATLTGAISTMIANSINGLDSFSDQE